jgi:hypothetical protein
LAAAAIVLRATAEWINLGLLIEGELAICAALHYAATFARYFE